MNTKINREDFASQAEYDAAVDAAVEARIAAQVEALDAAMPSWEDEEARREAELAAHDLDYLDD
ncbi:hypothetical protein DNL40_02230 [Xylanimonas oleitrophica]|uniref:Uncharacterized protein n=1 Tax=Xylanimonas oleitrophica TaxID=2607479 RepID=A0A2W5XX11_9MICO|nr:hypothetical protein [Xylanimonas oleitrophica]PZR55208.1 hypothetical protein DNL40_02230 [Xylanimonas oleitrophica]